MPLGALHPFLHIIYIHVLVVPLNHLSALAVFLAVFHYSNPNPRPQYSIAWSSLPSNVRWLSYSGKSRMLKHECARGSGAADSRVSSACLWGDAGLGPPSPVFASAPGPATPDPGPDPATAAVAATAAA